MSQVNDAMTARLNPAATLADMLHLAAQSSAGSGKGITFINSDKDQSVADYQSIAERASGLLGYLQKQGCEIGDEVILYLSDTRQFVEAFWAGQLGAMVPVPVAVGNSDSHRQKVFKVFAVLQRPVLYTNRKNLERLHSFAQAKGLSAAFDALRERTILIDDIDDISVPGELASPVPSDTAFIQFSSGSTGDPKGVVLTHDNLLHNLNSIAVSSELKDSDVFLSWMPLTHDLGLIGFHLTPIYMQIAQSLMPTELFVRRPLLWLQKAAEQRASILASPNFGYRHYLKAAASKGVGNLDLACVRLIFNGAEPISLALCDEFMQFLQPYGMPIDAMHAVYGLAEACLCVTFPRPGTKTIGLLADRLTVTAGKTISVRTDLDADGVMFLNHGKPIHETYLRIVNDAGETVDELVVGNVEIKGRNVTHGYYKRPDLNAELINADGWLDTGDLGFLYQGDFFITGRRKELLLFNGANFFPQDIEEICHDIEGLELGKVAVAAVPGHTDSAGTPLPEQIIAFVIHKGDVAAVVPTVKAVRTLVAEKTGLLLDAVVPVRSIPKTTSGKFQRLALGASFASGEFDEVLQSLSALLETGSGAGGNGAALDREHDSLTVRLHRIVQDVVSELEVSVEDNIFDIGTSSLKLAQIHERIDEEFPDLVEVADFFDYPTVAQLAAYLETKVPAAVSDG